MAVDTEALPPSPPPAKPRPLVGPLLCFVAVMAIIGNIGLVQIGVIVAIAFIIRAVRRHRQKLGDQLP